MSSMWHFNDGELHRMQKYPGEYAQRIGRTPPYHLVQRGRGSTAGKPDRNTVMQGEAAREAGKENMVAWKDN